MHTAEEQSTLEELARRARQEGYHLTVEHLADGRMRLEHRNVVFTMPKPLIREYLLELIE